MTLYRLLTIFALCTASVIPKARENLKAIIDKVIADRAPLAITRRRGEGAVLISESEWASIEETLYLQRSPKNAERLLGAVRGFEAGEAKGIDFP